MATRQGYDRKSWNNCRRNYVQNTFVDKCNGKSVKLHNFHLNKYFQIRIHVFMYIQRNFLFHLWGVITEITWRLPLICDFNQFSHDLIESRKTVGYARSYLRNKRPPSFDPFETNIICTRWYWYIDCVPVLFSNLTLHSYFIFIFTGWLYMAFLYDHQEFPSVRSAYKTDALDLLIY